MVLLQTSKLLDIKPSELLFSNTFGATKST